MKTMNLIASAGAIAALLLGGCAENPTQPYYGSNPPPVYSSPAAANASYGRVERIEVVQKSDPNNIAGTVIGGIVGGLIGHQIGSGSGNTAATIAGAAGGAYAGNQIQKRRRTDTETFRVSVRMNDGSFQTVTQENITDLREGDRVRVEGNQVYRY